MHTYEDSRDLAQSIADVATGAGTPTTALLTDMNQCLASSAGNAVEVREAVAFLTTSRRNPRLEAVTLALCAELLQSSGLANSATDANKQLRSALDSGRAAEIFGKMVHALGGPADFVENHDQHLPAAPVTRPVHAESPGKVTAVATRDLGMSVVRLGGGRTSSAQSIDHAVGLTNVIALRTEANDDRPLAVVHARTEADADQAETEIRAAFTIGHETPLPTPEIYERITPNP